MKKISVIGAGNMGGALIKGWLAAAKRGKAQLRVTAANRTPNALCNIATIFPELNHTTSNIEAVADADVVVIAVKPWLVEQVIAEILPHLNLAKQIIVSVAANVSTATLCTMLANDNCNVFYAMPNIAAEFGESMTFIAPAASCTAEATAMVEDIFRLVGETKVCEEDKIAAGMMISGCGIAYVMRYVRAIMQAGTEMGFYPHDAQEMAMQTMQGAVAVLRGTGLHPEAAIDKVTTPGGITIKGLNELDHSGFSAAVISSLKAGLK